MRKSARMKIIIFAIALTCSLAPAAAWARTIFNVGETAYESLSYFPKWTGMLERAATGQMGTPETVQRGGTCKPNPRFLCPVQEWDRFVSSKKTTSLSGLALLQEVNSELNKTRYVQDPINWGVPDFWAHLREFLGRNGDCEDYAISKYATLKRLGVPTQSMRIVVLEDQNLGLAHAILTVEIGETVYVLDNQIKAVLADSAIYHYQPVYSLNEHGWWMHRAPQGQ